MKLQTHVAFGLFFGAVFSYLVEPHFAFILFAGFAAFLPDIDWRMQYTWNMGNVHRKIFHNIWFMLILIAGGYIATRSLVLSLGLLVGILSHYVADSLTVSGIHWLYPYGKSENRFHTKGPINMSDENNRQREKIIRTPLFALAGFLFLIRRMEINPLSIEGVVSLGVFLVVGYALMEKMSKVIKKTIRNLGI